MLLPGDVVLVHGIWMNGLEMSLLAWRLRRQGFRVHRFHYASVTRSLNENAGALDAFIRALGFSPADFELTPVHLVAHSLGGLLVRQLFHDYPAQPPGRIVTLGSPHHGCQVAQALSRGRLGRYLLGQSAATLLSTLPAWTLPRDIGVIAGRVPYGVGRLVCKLNKPNDGTVALEETRLPGMRDYLVVAASHISLLFSRPVAHQVGHFLQHGEFQRRM